eukprot:4478814-Ditylum_brightwellii.AAC.1
MTTVGRILQSLQRTGFLPTKEDWSNLYVEDIVELRTLHQPMDGHVGLYDCLCLQLLLLFIYKT